MTFTDSLSVFQETNSELLTHSMSLFQNIINKLHNRISITSLNSFLSDVQSLYFDNPYHKWSHAVEVQIFLDDIIRILEAQSFIFLSPETKLFLSIAAICHDILHPGESNAKQIADNPIITTILNSPSINEKVSINKCIELVEKHSLLEKFSSEEKERFEEILSVTLLATDITLPTFDEKLENAMGVYSGEAIEEVEDVIEVEDVEDVREEDNENISMLKCGLLVRLADVANCLISKKSCVNGGFRLFCELNKRDLREVNVNEIAFKASEGQNGFFIFYIIPLLKKSLFYNAISKEVFDELMGNVEEIMEFFDMVGENGDCLEARKLLEESLEMPELE